MFIYVTYSLTINQQELNDHQTRTNSLYQTVLRQLLPLVRRGAYYLEQLTVAVKTAMTLLMFLSAV